MPVIDLSHYLDLMQLGPKESFDLGDSETPHVSAYGR